MVNKEELEKLLRDWRGRLAIAADERMEQLFESADDVLSEYADKAESNVVQTKFFDGRRELWQKRIDVAQLFRDKLARQLFEFMRPAQRVDAPGSETLSLVSKDKFERSLALQTISDQAIEKNRELYYALSLRLGAITGSPAVLYEELPAGPHQLAGVFENTVQVLRVERQVLLALYTLFEREVIRESPLWHEELNEALREKGILPNLKYEVKRDLDKPGAKKDESKEDINPAWKLPSYAGSKQESSRDSSHSSRQGGHGIAGARNAAHGHGRGSSPVQGAPDDWYQDQNTAGLPLGDQLLGRIRELLTARRASQTRYTGSPVRPDPVSPAPPSAVAAAIDRSQVQQAVPIPDTGTLEPGVHKVVVSRQLLEKVRAALLVQREQIKESVGEDKLSHFDEDTIDIVGMLFEVMLNDERLSNTVKALLSHLHTPYLKLAVRDRAFLKRQDHPARHLFDNMVEAGSRWVDERDLTQGIYPKLQRVVDLIMEAGEHPLKLLEELDDGLSAEIALRSKRQLAREARTVEAEKGKARLEEAREAAVQVTQPILEDGETPLYFLEFISGPWTDYLTLLYLRSNGDTGNGNWLGALELCGRLRKYVDDWARGGGPNDDDLQELRDELGERLADAIPHYGKQVQKLFEMFSTSYEVTIVAPQPVESTLAPAPRTEIMLSTGGEELLQRLPQLPPGSWVAFHHQDNTDQVVKLSWFNDKTERFLFVDQAGAKALVVPLRKLADQIDRERAHVLHATGTSYVESSLQRALSTFEKRA